MTEIKLIYLNLFTLIQIKVALQKLFRSTGRDFVNNSAAMINGYKMIF